MPFERPQNEGVTMENQSDDMNCMTITKALDKMALALTEHNHTFDDELKRDYNRALRAARTWMEKSKAKEEGLDLRNNVMHMAIGAVGPGRDPCFTIAMYRAMMAELSPVAISSGDHSGAAVETESAPSPTCPGWPPAELSPRERALPQVGRPLANAHDLVGG
jgi:hypothetical protein